MNAIKRKAGKPQDNEEKYSAKNSTNFRSDDSAGGQTGISGDTI